MADIIMVTRYKTGGACSMHRKYEKVATYKIIIGKLEADSQLGPPTMGISVQT
jgi:hypothetical protein